MKPGAAVLANPGTGCDALGQNQSSGLSCVSGIIGWQLFVPGLAKGARITVLPDDDPPPSTLAIPGVTAIPDGGGGRGGASVSFALELFVDQQICEIFVHDQRGRGSAVSTFGCSPASAANVGAAAPSGVAVTMAGVDGLQFDGALSDMAGSILPPAPPEAS